MTKNSYLKIIILTVIFGLGAGIVGQLFVNAYLLTPEVFVGAPESKINKKITQSEENQKIIEAHDAVAPAVLEIYPQKINLPTGSLGQIYLPSDRAALGVSLTSDGWLVSFGRALADSKNHYVVITADHQIFLPKQIIFDEATEVVFIKIEAQNLPIPKLGAYENLSLGEKIIFPFGKQSLAASEIKDLNYEKSNEIKDLFRSSEKFSKSLLFTDKLAANEIGVPTVNYESEVIGIVSDPEGRAIPTDFWRPAFLEILKNNKISRTYLGLRYLDLAETFGLAETISQGKSSGALLWSDLTLQIQSVAKNSPAAKTGLKNGDIIIKINSEEITAKNDLAEIIQDYNPGDEINVTFLRNGKEETAKVVLGEKL